MKLKSLQSLMLIICLAMTNLHVAHAQNSKKEKKAARATAVKNMVDAKRYVFQAQSAMPMKGGTRQLSLGYVFRVMPDSIISDLPYYGRAYQASMDQSGIQFTSTDFEYSVKILKKGGWYITIKPNDARNFNPVSLTISQDGYASVSVTCADRQSISFNGFIEEQKQK